MGNEQSTVPLLEDPDGEAQNRSINLLLLGRTGTGKSSTANNILHLSKDSFISEGTDSSFTIECQADYTRYQGRDVKVVDMPGLSDANKEEGEDAKHVVGSTLDAVAETPRGYDAILIVIQYGGQTNGLKTTMEQLKDMFGHDIFKQYGILVVTRGDDFKKEGKNKTFEQYSYFSQRTGHEKELWEACNRRAVLFDNLTTDKGEMEAQRQKLFAIIEKMRNTTRYTPALFEAAKATRQTMIQNAEDMILTDALKKKLRFIMHDLRDVDVDNPEEAMQQLIQIEKRAEVMIEEIKIQAEKTRALKRVLNLAEEICRAIQIKQDLIHSVIKCQAKKEVRNKIIERLRIEAGAVSSFQTESEKEYEKAESEINKKKEKMDDTETQLDKKYLILLRDDDTKKKMIKTIATELLLLIDPAALGGANGVGAGVGAGVVARVLKPVADGVGAGVGGGVVAKVLKPVAARGLSWAVAGLTHLVTTISAKVVIQRQLTKEK